jgi:hypothetical protein
MQLGQLVAAGSVGNIEVLVATISQYRLAPVTLDQEKVGLVEIPVTPFEGPKRVGAARSNGVVLKSWFAGDSLRLVSPFEPVNKVGAGR